MSALTNALYRLEYNRQLNDELTKDFAWVKDGQLEDGLTNAITNDLVTGIMMLLWLPQLDEGAPIEVIEETDDQINTRIKLKLLPQVQRMYKQIKKPLEDIILSMQVGEFEEILKDCLNKV